MKKGLSKQALIIYALAVNHVVFPLDCGYNNSSANCCLNGNGGAL